MTRRKKIKKIKKIDFDISDAKKQRILDKIRPILDELEKWREDSLYSKIRI